MLKLKDLRITDTNYYPNKPAEYRGTIEYVGDKGRVTVTVDAEICQKMLPVIADAIVAASREVAEQLTAEAIASVPVAPLKIA